MPFQKHRMLVPVISGLLSSTALCQQADRGTVMWYVERAQAKHQTEVQLPFPIAIYVEYQNFKHALKTGALIRAHLEDSRTSFTSHEIFTWEKYRISEILWDQPSGDREPLPHGIPPDWLPLQPGEFVVASPGGQVTLRGVRVTITDPDVTPLPKDEDRLLFLRFFSSGRIAVPHLGPRGVFSVRADNRLRAMVDRDFNEVRRDLEDNFGLRINSVRSAATVAVTTMQH